MPGSALTPAKEQQQSEMKVRFWEPRDPNGTKKPAKLLKEMPRTATLDVMRLIDNALLRGLSSNCRGSGRSQLSLSGRELHGGVVEFLPECSQLGLQTVSLLMDVSALLAESHVLFKEAVFGKAAYAESALDASLVAY